MDNLNDGLGVRRINKMEDGPIMKMCGVKKRENGNKNENALKWFGHLKEMKDS